MTQILHKWLTLFVNSILSNPGRCDKAKIPMACHELQEAHADPAGEAINMSHQDAFDMIYLADMKWPEMAPTIYPGLSGHSIEMLFDGALSKEDMLHSAPMKFLLCMLKDPLGELPKKERDIAVQFGRFLVNLCGSDPTASPDQTKQHVFNAEERMVLVKTGKHSGCSNGPVFSVMVLRGPSVPELTPFQVSFYQYCIEPDLAKNVRGLDTVTDAQYHRLVDSYIQNHQLGLAEIRKLYALTELPVYFIVAWFEDFYRRSTSKQ